MGKPKATQETGPAQASPPETIHARVRFSPVTYAVMLHGGSGTSHLERSCDAPCRFDAEALASFSPNQRHSQAARDAVSAARELCGAHNRKWPQSFVDVDVTLEELDELESDRGLTVEYSGKEIAAEARMSPHERTVQNLEERIALLERETEIKVANAVSVARSEWQRSTEMQLAAQRQSYETGMAWAKDKTRLEHVIRILQGQLEQAKMGINPRPNGTEWFGLNPHGAR